MRKDFYQRAYDVVEAKLTEALIILQEENGITDGGCDPFAELQYEESRGGYGGSRPHPLGESEEMEPRRRVSRLWNRKIDC